MGLFNFTTMPFVKLNISNKHVFLVEDYSDEEMEDDDEEEVEEEEEDIEESPVKKVTKNGAGKVRLNFK